MKTVLRITLHLLVIYLILSIESPLLRSFHIRLYAPDPGLALVAVAALTLPFLQGLLTAALAGLLQDGFAAGIPVGTYVEIYLLVFLACSFTSTRLDYRNPVLMSIVLFCASILASLLMFSFLAIFDRDFNQFDLIWRLSIPQALITAPMGPILLYVSSLIERILSKEHRGSLR
jgi:rod shape-determining protein MreD